MSALCKRSAVLVCAVMMVLTSAACHSVVPLGKDSDELKALNPICTSAIPYRRSTIPGNSTHCLRWNERTLTYRVAAKNARGRPTDEEVAAVYRAFATWEAASDRCSDLLFVPGRRLDSAVTANDGQTAVLFRDRQCEGLVPLNDPCWTDLSCGNQYGCWGHGDSPMALTTSTYSASTGELQDADIELNGASFVLSTVDAPACDDAHQSVSCVANDVQGTLTHEIGHMLGLDHTDAIGSTMEATSHVGSTSKRLVDSGSACFLCSVYPAGAPSNDCQ